MEQPKDNTIYREDQSGSQAVRMLRQRAKDGTLKDVLRDWLWIWSFSRGRWGSVLLYTLFGIGSSLLGLASGVVSKYLIDCIMARDSEALLPLAALTAAAAGLAMGLRMLTTRFSAKLNIAMHNDVQAKVFHNLLHSEWGEITRYPTGELLSRFSGDVNTVAGCAVSWLPNVIIQGFTVLATLAVVLYYDPIMALIAFASTPALIFASRRLMRRQRSFNQKLRTVSGGMAAFEAETFRNIDTLKSFGVEDSMNGKLRRWQEEYRDVSLEYNRFSIRTSAWLSAMANGVQLLALAYCLWRLWRGDILLGTMVLFLQQRANLSSAFSSLISLVPTALSGSVAAERIRELTELKKEPRQHGCAVSPAGSCGVELRGIRVAYSDDKKVVLSDVDIFAGSGHAVALVGPSGEGKSTLMRLMLGLVYPDEGEMYLTDENGVRYPLGADTRHCFTYVPQGNTVLAGTIAENLRLVNPHVTEAEMIAALEDACAWEFVKEMPLKLDSPIGEGGKGLSEGQAQRIAIARALVRNAPVMLLDEVTSALDYATEQRVLERIMRRGVTCIVATHRPSVLSMCSRAYRVREGRVELLSQSQMQELISFDTKSQ